MAFIFAVTSPAPSYAQGLKLPVLGSMVNVSPSFVPPMLKGIKVDPKQPFNFDFILDTGTFTDPGSGQKDEDHPEPGSEEVRKLIRYFLASLTIPEKDLWVNLSPYEKDRIIPNEFSQTEMGRDLLAQDYILKQITASLIYPENETGKAFWAKVYAAAYEKYGTTNVPVDTFNKVWIVPNKAVVYENGTKAFVTQATLKVMLETDYAAQASNVVGADLVSARERADIKSAPTNDMTKNIIREIIIPILEKEVNEGANFAQLRQVYYSLILAKWYKETLKESIINRKYSDQKKMRGVDLAGKGDKQLIYEQYLEAFKKGAFNYVKEEYDTLAQETIPRKYFSGGCDFAQKVEIEKTTDASEINMVGDALNVDGVFTGVVDKDEWSDVVEAMMEAARNGTSSEKDLLEQLIFKKTGSKNARVLLSNILRQHKSSLVLRVHEQSSVTAARGLLKYLGVQPQDNVTIGYWNEVDAQKAADAFKGYRITHAPPGAFDKEEKGVIIDFNDDPSFAIRDNNLILPYHPFKYAMESTPDEVIAQIKKELGINGRQVFVVGSPSADDLKEFIGVYKRSYGNMPVDQHPVVIVAPRGASTREALQELGSIGDVVTRERSMDPVTKNRIPFEAMAERNILVVRTQGELQVLYGVADISFVGVDRNMLEPARLGKPVFYFKGGWVNNGKMRDLLANKGAALEFSEKGMMDLSRDEGSRGQMGSKGIIAANEVSEEISSMSEISVMGALLMSLAQKADHPEEEASSGNERSMSDRDRFAPHLKSRNFSWYRGMLENMGMGRDFLRGLFRDKIVQAGRITYADFGCGPGAALEQALELFGRRSIDAIGVDLVDWRDEATRKDQMELVKKHIPHEISGEIGEYEKYLSGQHFEFVQGDVKDVSLPRRADVITSFFTLQYSDDPLGAMANMFNQLSPGGVMLVNQVIPFSETGMFDVYQSIVVELKKTGIDVELKVADTKERNVRILFFVVRRKGQERIKVNAEKTFEVKELKDPMGSVFEINVVNYVPVDGKPIIEVEENIGFQDLVGQVNSPVRQVVERSLYMFSNEEERAECLLKLGNLPRKDRSLYVGFSGLFNLDIIAVRKPEFGIIGGISPGHSKMYKAIKEVITHDAMLDSRVPVFERRQVFVKQLFQKFVAAGVFEWERRYYPAWGVGGVESKLSLLLNESGGWLSTDEGFQYIQKMFLEGRLEGVQLDVTDTDRFKAIGQWARYQGVRVDAVYVSNIFDWLGKGPLPYTLIVDTEKREQFIESLEQIMDRETYLIDSHYDTQESFVPKVSVLSDPNKFPNADWHHDLALRIIEKKRIDRAQAGKDFSQQVVLMPSEKAPVEFIYEDKGDALVPYGRDGFSMGKDGVLHIRELNEVERKKIKKMNRLFRMNEVGVISRDSNARMSGIYAVAASGMFFLREDLLSEGRLEQISEAFRLMKGKSSLADNKDGVKALISLLYQKDSLAQDQKRILDGSLDLKALSLDGLMDVMDGTKSIFKTLYILSNETDRQSVLLALSKMPHEGSLLHLGFSGFFNLDIMVSRKSDFGIIGGIDYGHSQMYRAIKETILSPEATDKTIPVSMRRDNFVTALSLNFLKQGIFDMEARKDAQGNSLSLMSNLAALPDEQGSWLSTDEGFEHIQRMFQEGRIGYLQLDIRDTDKFKMISLWAKANKIKIDTIYTSNIYDWFGVSGYRSSPLPHDKNTEQFVESLVEVAEKDTHVVWSSWMNYEGSPSVITDIDAPKELDPNTWQHLLAKKVAEKGAIVEGHDMAQAPGGIDLDPGKLELQKQGQGVAFDFPVDGNGENIQINGLVPVIRSITPVGDVRLLMSAGS